MRTTILALGAVAILSSACSWRDEDDAGISPSGAGGQRSYQATGFEKVELAGSDDVEVRVGPAFSVRAEGPAEVLDRLRIEVDDKTLEIGRRRGMSSVNRKARIVVTLPRLSGTSLAGSGNLSVDRVSGGDVDVDVAGSGNLRLGQVQVGKLDVDIAGSGTLRAAGTAQRIEVDIAGSGDFDGTGLTARGAEVSVAGSGNVRTIVDGAAKVAILGSGDVDLGAKARCEVSKMGSGSVRCGN